MTDQSLTPEQRIEASAQRLAEAFALSVVSAQEAAAALNAMGPIIDKVFREHGIDPATPTTARGE